MPIDTAPGTVANNALGALDFTSLIGGPMDAIIKAQALAAKTTYEFISEVGLTTDPITGEKKPVNVVFQYNNNGKLTTLTIPLLVILTIPNLEVTQFVIDFIANISASASSQEETTKDTELGLDLDAEAALKVGPFSLKVKAKANYSSKQHSKASQDSKYSVEYTMNVNVQGGQSGMPAGLQTVLNILQSSSSSVSPDEQVVMSPAALDFDKVNTSYLNVTLKDKQGILIVGSKVKVDVVPQTGKPQPFKAIEVVKGSTPANLNAALKALDSHQSLSSLKRPELIVSSHVLKSYKSRYIKSPADYLLKEEADVSTKTAVTDNNGVVSFEFVLDDNVYNGKEDLQGVIMVEASLPVPNNGGKFDIETFSIPYAIIPNEVKTPPALAAKSGNTNKSGAANSETELESK